MNLDTESQTRMNALLGTELPVMREGERIGTVIADTEVKDGGLYGTFTWEEEAEWH